MRRVRLSAWALLASVIACSQVLDFGGLDTEPPIARDGGDPSVDGAAFTEDGASPGSAYRAAVIADAPFAYWRFGEAEGPRAIDEMGRAHGTYFGTPTLRQPGALASDANTAWKNSGPSGGMSAGPSFAAARTSSFSLEAWIFPDIIDNEYRDIFHEKISNAAGRQNIALFVRAPSVIFERIVDDVRIGAGAPAPAIGSWHHVAATYDGATLKLYVDGALADASPDARAAAPREVDLYVGTTGPTLAPFLGSLDEGAVYLTALPADRVRLHAEIARSGKQP